MSQGSSLGPTLWNLVIDGWFRALEQTNTTWKRDIARRIGVEVEYVKKLALPQVYADDQLVIIPGRSVRDIRTKWDTCQKWESASNSKYNLAKIQAIFI